MRINDGLGRISMRNQVDESVTEVSLVESKPEINQKDLKTLGNVWVVRNITPLGIMLLVSLLYLVCLKLNIGLKYVNYSQENASDLALMQLGFFLVVTILEIPLFIYLKYKIAPIRHKLPRRYFTSALFSPLYLSAVFYFCLNIETAGFEDQARLFIFFIIFIGVGYFNRIFILSQQRRRLRNRAVNQNDPIAVKCAEVVRNFKIRYNGVILSPNPIVLNNPRFGCSGTFSLTLFHRNIDGISDTALEAVILHEISHFKHKDIAKRFMFGFLSVAATLMFVRWALLLGWVVNFTGATLNTVGLEFPVAIGLTVICYLLSSILYRAIERHQEYTADAFVVMVKHDFVGMQEVLEYLDKGLRQKFTPMLYLFRKTHPSLEKRVKRMKSLSKASAKFDIDGEDISFKSTDDIKKATNRVIAKNISSFGVIAILIALTLYGIFLVRWTNEPAKISLSSLNEPINSLVYFEPTNASGPPSYAIYPLAALSNANPLPIRILPGSTFEINPAKKEAVIAAYPSVEYGCLSAQTQGSLRWYYLINGREFGSTIADFGDGNLGDPDISYSGNLLFYDSFQDNRFGKCQESVYEISKNYPLTPKLILSCQSVINCVGMADPNISPNGQYLAYLYITGVHNSQNVEFGTMAVEVMNLSTHKSVTIAQCNLNEACWPERGLQWSNDGKELAFTMNNTVYLWNQHTGLVKNLFSCSMISDCLFPENLIFSPDSKWLAFDIYSGNVSGQLIVVNTVGTNYASIAQSKNYFGTAYWYP